MTAALADHLTRIEQENLSERWAPPTYREGDFAKTYARECLKRRVGESGWCRIWCHFIGDLIVAHASLFDIGQDDICGGHVSVEHPYRGQRIARSLQDKRLAFCDEHDLTLMGPLAPHNDASARGCANMGFEPVRVDSDGWQWVARLPRGQRLKSNE